MKKIIWSLCVVGFLASCDQKGTTKEESTATSYFVSEDTAFAKPNEKQGYGESFEVKDEQNLVEFVKNFSSSQNNEEVVLAGKIDQICEVKGCWMTLDKGDGSSMRVKFKDYAFFVPRDAEGKEVIIKGAAKLDTTSVEMLQHYAQDEGLSQAAIDSITEPEIDLNFVATGVYIK